MAVNFIDANAYSLLDYALNSNDPIVKETYLTMIEAGSVFNRVPIVERKSFKTTGTRITGDLQAPLWKSLQSAPTVEKDPDPEWWEEGVFFFESYIQCNKYELQEENSINDPFELRTKTKLKAHTYDLNDAVINNTHVTYTNRQRAANAACFVGWRERLDNPALYGTNPACKIDGGGVNLGASGTGNDGIQMGFLIEQALSEIGSPDGTDVCLVANSRFRRSYNRAVKKSGSGGGFEYTKDAYDRSVEVFMNAEVVDCGRLAPSGTKAARTQVPVITETETADGSADTGGNFTSVYLVKFGPEDFFGWHFEPLKPSDPYLLPDGKTFQVNIMGSMGVAMPNPRAVARIFDIAL